MISTFISQNFGRSTSDSLVAFKAFAAAVRVATSKFVCRKDLCIK